MNSNFNKMPTSVTTTTATNLNNNKATENGKNTDTIALLKRVENLRKWQEEEQKKLLKAHEMQLQQFKNEQERISRLVIKQQNGLLLNGDYNDDDDDDDENDEELIKQDVLSNENDTDDDNDDDEDYFIHNNNDNNCNINGVDDRLSTILEVSCEENNTPFKQQQKQIKRLSDETAATSDKRKSLFNNIVQEEDEEEEEEEEDVEVEEEEEDEGEIINKQNLDDIPVNGDKGKSFEQLLEEKLKQEEASKSSSNLNKKQTNGKKFLKKGEGLVRFKPQNQSLTQKQQQQQNEEQQIKASKPMQRSRSSSSSNINQNKQDSCVNQDKQQPHKSRVTNNNKPQQPKATQANKKPIINKNTSTTVNSKPPASAQQPAAPPVNHQQQQQQKKSQITKQELVRKSIEKNDEEELKEFEALEQYADEHPSFRSTASFVETILTNNTNGSSDRLLPVNSKGAGLSSKLVDLIEELNENDLNNNRNYLEQTLIDDDEDEVEEKQEDYNKKIVQRKVKRINYDYIESSASSNDDDNDENQNFEQLNSIRKRLGSMDFVQSSQEDAKLKQQNTNIQNNKQYNSNTYTSTSQIEIRNNNDDDRDKYDFDDNDTWLDLKDNLTKFTNNTSKASLSSVPSTTMTASSAPVSDLMAKLFPTLKPQQQQQQPLKQKQIEMTNNNESSSSNNAMGSLLKEKLSQLESEIEKFRVNNADIKKLKDKHEIDLKQLERNVLEFENQKLEEIRKFREYKEEEMKKLKNEKKLFEQYQKSIKDNPDRRERDEIDRLKKLNNELNEELKQKENRWLANNKRLKDRIEILEKEKEELKEELMLLEKQRLEQLMQQKQQNQFKAHNGGGYQEQLFVDSSLNGSNDQLLNISPTTQQPVATLPTVLTRSISERSISSFTNSSSSSAAPVQSLTGANKFNNSSSRQSITSTTNLNRLMSPTTPLSPASSTTNNIANLYLNGGSNNQNSNKTVKFKLDNEQPQQPKQFITTLIGSRQVELKEIKKCDDGRVEKLLDDGTIVTEFANGTIKEVSSNKRHTFVNFYNGDRKEMNLDAGTETYFYAQTNVTQVTYTANRLQVFKFPNGQIEKHYADKTKEIIFPDKIVKIIYANGTEESRLTNGTVIKVEKNGDKIIEYSNKQREIHTKDYKRREYPDGSVKTVYSNGMTETRYANGRIRVKDEIGNVISDKKG